MTITDLSRIDKTIEIKASPQRVWQALTNSSELSTWFQVAIEGNIAAGQEVWMTSTHEQHSGLRFRVRFVELIPPRRLVWEWHPGVQEPLDDAQEPRTKVTFTLQSAQGGTRLSVAETGFDEVAIARRAKAYAENSQGWTEVLVWLQTYVEAAG